MLLVVGGFAVPAVLSHARDARPGIRPRPRARRGHRWPSKRCRATEAGSRSTNACATPQPRSRCRECGAVHGDTARKAGVRFTPSVSIPGNPAATELRILAAPVSPGGSRRSARACWPGRDFDSATARGRPVVIVNEAFAKRYLNGAPPIGQTILVGPAPADLRPTEIVGLVRDAAFTSVRPMPPRSTDRLLKRSMRACWHATRRSASACGPAGERSAVSLTNARPPRSRTSNITTASPYRFKAVTETLTPHTYEL